MYFGSFLDPHYFKLEGSGIVDGVTLIRIECQFSLAVARRGAKQPSTRPQKECEHSCENGRDSLPHASLDTNNEIPFHRTINIRKWLLGWSN